MKKFADSRKQNAVLFMNEQGMSHTLGGKWTNGKSYDHILKIDKGHNQLDIIKSYNVLSGINADLLSAPHRFAHHLTSSQVMCYNFFRPLMDSHGKLSEELKELFEKKNISIPEDSICEFEAINTKDNTSYDMKINHITFEIKYTENGFGKAKSDDRHQLKFEETYKGMLETCNCLISVPDKQTFFKYYQLFRNILHIDDKNKFAVFIFPRGNKRCVKEFEEFNKLIEDEYKNNIQVWYWDDLLKGKEDSDFYQKYLR